MLVLICLVAGWSAHRLLRSCRCTHLPIADFISHSAISRPIPLEVVLTPVGGPLQSDKNGRLCPKVCQLLNDNYGFVEELDGLTSLVSIDIRIVTEGADRFRSTSEISANTKAPASIGGANKRASVRGT